MKLHRVASLIVSYSAVLLPALAHGADGKMPDPDLPQPFNAGMAQPLLESSPFTRALDLSDTLRLTGIAYVQGKPVVTLVNKTTKQNYIVSETANAEGWRIAKVNPGSQIRHTEVKIMVGSEIVSLRYSETQLAPSKKSYMPSKIPTPEEFMGHDEKGNYVRGMPYLSDEDRARLRSSLSREVREKFLNIVHDQREMLFKASHEERAAFAKKALDAAEGK